MLTGRVKLEEGGGGAADAGEKEDDLQVQAGIASTLKNVVAF